jgi:hypothetical protein
MGLSGQTHVTPESQMKERGGGASPGRRRWVAVAASYVAWKVRRSTAILRRAALFISLVSLVFSGVSLYETVLKQPHLTIVAGCNWQYGRGPGSFDEYFVVPITIANDGARTGTVLAINLAVDNSGRAKAFNGNFTVTSLDDKTRQLFAPLAISGHDSATASVVFIQRASTRPPLFGDVGHYHARLKLKTTRDISYGFVERLFADSAPEAGFEIVLQRFDIAAILGGQPASFDACTPDLTDVPAEQEG